MITRNKLLSIYILFYLVILVINLSNVFDNIFLTNGNMWTEFTNLSPPKDSPSPGPNGPNGPGGPNSPNGPNGPNGPDGSNVVTEPSNVNAANLLEQKRVTLFNKLYQLSYDSHSVNSSKKMNSPTLVNMSFDNTDRDYMRYHLNKFHTRELANDNAWGNVGNKGFSCKTTVSREKVNLFKDINTPGNS